MFNSQISGSRKLMLLPISLDQVSHDILSLTVALLPPFAIRRVDPPLEGWCQTVPNEGIPRLILRLNPLIRTGLEDGSWTFCLEPGIRTDPTIRFHNSSSG
jgi:hypothetical protein